jgi:hypothetical protein
MRTTDDYFEWDLEYAEADEARAAAGNSVANLYDREVRIRIGEVIARAMQAANKKQEP